MLILFAAKRKLLSAIPTSLFANHFRQYASIPRPTNPMSVEYLVATYGFSPAKSALVSKPIAHIKFPDKPEAVRSFLNKEGFSDAQVKSIITLQPPLLCASPENTLYPNLRALRKIGLSDLNQLILVSPIALQLSSAAPRIEFWRDFFGGDEATLLKAFKNNPALVSKDISRNIAPKVSLLQSWGLSTKDIQRIVLKAARILTSKASVLEDALNRTKELGLQPESLMFVATLQVMVFVSKEALHVKMEFFKSCGWSEEDFLSAVRKAPNVFGLTEKNLKMKMDFLVGEVKCEPSYIASSPVLLTLSLDKRLRPRLRVLHLLESKGVSCKRLSLNSAVLLSDKGFVERFIVPHKERIAGLHEAYYTPCA